MRLLLPPAVVLLAALASCTVTAGPPPPTPVVVESSTGTLTVEWTIKGADDPLACEQTRADVIELTVTSTAGGFVGRYERGCTLFTATLTLDVGTYVGTATLMEAPGRPRTTTATIETFTIASGTDFTTPVDFPASSFLDPGAGPLSSGPVTSGGPPPRPPSPAPRARRAW